MPTYTTTAKRALRWLQGGNLVSDVDAGFQALAEDVDAQFGSSGKSIIATSESRTNTAYGLLTTPDRVQSVVLPTDSLIAIWFQATWRESVANAATAAFFLGSNQIQIAPSAIGSSDSGPVVHSGGGSSGGATGVDRVLSTKSTGLYALPPSAIGQYTGDVTTGQIIGTDGGDHGGPCYIFAAAGTYDVSVQFKATSGSVTVKNRKLWVRALPF